MKMAFLPKRTRGGLATLWIDLHFGSLETLKGRAAAADLVGALLDRGTTTRDRGQVDQAFDGLSASVSLGGDATGARVRLVVPEENLEPALELVAECLKTPALSEKEFATLRSEALTALAQAKGDPSDRASDLMESHFSPYPPGDLRHHRTLDEQAADLKAASVEQVRAFHRHFYGASDAEVAAVGQFDPDRLKSLLERLFGDWRTPVPYERVPEPFIPIAPKDALVSIPDKPNAVLLGAAPLRLRSDDPDYPALLVASTILGGGWLDSRLSVRIRTTEGTSYHVGMGLSVPDLDDGARWSFYAICGPKNLGLVRRAFREELDRALAKGFSADETERARNYLLSARRVERSQDSTLAKLLASQLFLDRTFAWTADLEAKIAVVTPDSAWSALKRHLDPTAFSLVEAGDLEGKDK
jgi:zinc protease